MRPTDRPRDPLSRTSPNPPGTKGYAESEPRRSFKTVDALPPFGVEGALRGDRRHTMMPLRVREAIVAGIFLLLTVGVASAGEDRGLSHPGVDGVSSPELFLPVSPVYPAEAWTERPDVTVVAAVMVLADGSVGAVEVIESSIAGLGFEREAIDAIRQWQYRPAFADQLLPVDSYAFVRLNFRAPAAARAELAGTRIESRLMASSGRTDSTTDEESWNFALDTGLWLDTGISLIAPQSVAVRRPGTPSQRYRSLWKPAFNRGRQGDLTDQSLARNRPGRLVNLPRSQTGNGTAVNLTQSGQDSKR